MGHTIPFTITDNMRQLVIVLSVLGLTLGMPQGAPRQQLVQDAPARGSDNLFTKIISLKTKQEGADFGHLLFRKTVSVQASRSALMVTSMASTPMSRKTVS